MGWAQTQPTWALGFEDEVWWSREAQPHLHSWSEAGKPLRLVEQSVARRLSDIWRGQSPPGEEALR